MFWGEDGLVIGLGLFCLRINGKLSDCFLGFYRVKVIRLRGMLVTWGESTTCLSTAKPLGKRRQSRPEFRFVACDGGLHERSWYVLFIKLNCLFKFNCVLL